MSKQLDAVFTPLQIGNVTVKNRILLAPMEGTGLIEWMGMCKSNAEKVHDFYIERAADGVGLFVPGMIPVRSMMRDKWLYEGTKVFDEVKPLVDEIHSYGAKIFFQLGVFAGRNFTMATQMSKLIDHPALGKLAKPLLNMDSNMVSPDDGLPNVFMPEYKTRALSTGEVEELVQAYILSAEQCKRIGVDGVEVHAVHEGYLMDQFTLPYCNHRTDKYGGSFENRYRFATEVIRGIKEKCGEDYPVSLRYSVESKTIDFNVGAVPGETYQEIGRDMAESEKAIQLLEAAGVDMFSCDNGTYDAWYWAHPPVYMPLNCNLEDVEHIKKFTSKPVYCAGRMEMETADEAIRAGKLDGVAIGRQFLCDEHFVSKVREGKAETVRPCIACHSGCFSVSTFKGHGIEMNIKEYMEPRMCALNSHSFAEKTYAVKPAQHPKKIAVIGGGIGGMEFAIQAAQRGHTVDLYEKSDALGGAFIPAAAPSFKEKDRDLLAWYERELRACPARVHKNTEIKDLHSLDADEIVIATGAKEPRRLRIPGAEKAITAIDFLMNMDLAGETVAVIGGGLTGCEIAYELALQGKKPFLVEMEDDLVKVVGVSAANSNMLRDIMRAYKIPVYLEATTTEIGDGTVTIQQNGQTICVPADTVITSIGYVNGVPFTFDQKNKHIHVIGDAAKVSNLKNAIWSADDLAVKLSK